MPEGKKKDSFTFSDKIKNSKPAGSKSFANRIFAKIGKDGKPRQTLYERTRRDAPFFIAAVIALLLLPFLYKYSGSVGDDNEISPITGDLMQDPDSRDGYYSFVDSGNSALAPYPGNDTALLLVKPYAGEDSEAITEEQVPDVYTSSYDSSEKRDGYADSSAQKKASKLRDKETNILNEYRKRAAATTRKAFKRTPTKINSLGSAGLRRPGGSKLGVNMWGGGLKKAADKVKGGPTEGPKPVSLQPLTAAGKPSRSSFGQGHLAAAQKSKDAMSKANPMEALRDAQIRAIDNHRVGGMDFDRNPFGPGGGGQLKHDFNYNGKEPWWWDMMKTRMQTQWQKMFDYKWGWIDWGTDLLRHWLGGILNCLITGNEDGDMGTMFGTSGGSGDKEATCCGTKISYLRNGNKDLSESYSDDEKFCKALKGNKPDICPNGGGYKAGRVYSKAGSGWWSTRKSCLGVKGSAFDGDAAIDFDPLTSCKLFEASNGTAWFLNPTGKALKWHKYIYVLAHNRLPAIIAGHTGSKYLCGEQNSAFYENSLGGSAKDAGGEYAQHIRNTANNNHNEWESALDLCVIDVQSSSSAKVMFNFNTMKERQLTLFKEVLANKVDEGCPTDKPICTACGFTTKNGKPVSSSCDCRNANKCKSVEDAAEEAFGQLALHRVEGMVSKDYLAYDTDTLRAHSDKAKRDYDAAQKAYDEAKAVHDQAVKGKSKGGVVDPGTQAKIDAYRDAKERLDQAEAVYKKGVDALSKDALPMPYLLFRNAYVAHYGMSSSPNDRNHTWDRGFVEGSVFNGFKSRLDFSKAKARIEGETRVWGEDNQILGDYGCNWADRVSISCGPTTEDGKAHATITTVKLAHGTTSQDFQVVASFEQEEGENKLADLTSAVFGSASEIKADGKNFIVTERSASIDFGRWETSSGSEGDSKSFAGHVKWKIMQNNVVVSEAVCAYKSTAGKPVKKTVGGSEVTFTSQKITEKLCGNSGFIVNSVPAAQYANKVIHAFNKYLEDNKALLAPKFGFDDENVPGKTMMDFLTNNKAKWCDQSSAEQEGCPKYNYKSGNINVNGGFYPFGAGENFENPQSHNLPTLAEFIHVLRMVHENKESIKVSDGKFGEIVDFIPEDLKRVPKNAVCAVAAALSARSVDSSVKEEYRAGNDITNPFGVFLQYIGTSSVLFPGQRVEQGKDVRFHVDTTKSPEPYTYAWGRYITGNATDLTRETKAYFANRTFPLKEMALGAGADFSAWHVNDSNKGDKRTSYRSEYEKIISGYSGYDYEAKLGDLCYTGSGWVYPVNATIDIENVWAWLDGTTNDNGVCGEGEIKFTKPWAGRPVQGAKGGEGNRGGKMSSSGRRTGDGSDADSSSGNNSLGNSVQVSQERVVQN